MINFPSNMTFIRSSKYFFLLSFGKGSPWAPNKSGRNMNLSFPLRRLRIHIWPPCINWQKKSREIKPDAKKKTGQLQKVGGGKGMERRKEWDQVVRMRCQNSSLSIPTRFTQLGLLEPGNDSHTSKINKSFKSARIRREPQKQNTNNKESKCTANK